MDVKVLRTFAANGHLYKQGATEDMSPEQFEKLNSTSLGTLLADVKDGDPDLEEMTKKELIAYAQNRGLELELKMSRREMLERLG